MIGESAILLVAGNNPSDLERLVSHLQNEEFRVLCLANRETILDLARSENPKLIIFDVGQCFDLCRTLKRNFVTEPIPIIVILSAPEESDRIAVLELGADDCIAKPYNFRELTLRIRASLNRTRDKQGKTRYKQSKYYSALARPAV
jgi:DNA-binding response OmpR family regulator